MKQIPQLSDPGEIRRLVSERTEIERAEFEKTETEASSSLSFTSERILKALNANEDGDAHLFIELHRGRFVFDHATGQWYEFPGHFWREDTI
jgi:hypothetical protein